MSEPNQEYDIFVPGDLVVWRGNRYWEPLDGWDRERSHPRGPFRVESVQYVPTSAHPQLVTVIIAGQAKTLSGWYFQKYLPTPLLRRGERRRTIPGTKVRRTVTR